MGGGDIAPHILDLGTRWSLVVSFTLRPLCSRAKNSVTHWIRGWMGPKARPDVVAKTYPAVPGIELQSSSP
jgi:hypothetical protein